MIFILLVTFFVLYIIFEVIAILKHFIPKAYTKISKRTKLEGYLTIHDIGKLHIETVHDYRVYKLDQVQYSIDPTFNDVIGILLSIYNIVLISKDDVFVPEEYSSYFCKLKILNDFVAGNFIQYSSPNMSKIIREHRRIYKVNGMEFCSCQIKLYHDGIDTITIDDLIVPSLLTIYNNLNNPKMLHKISCICLILSLLETCESYKYGILHTSLSKDIKKDYFIRMIDEVAAILAVYNMMSNPNIAISKKDVFYLPYTKLLDYIHDNYIKQTVGRII